MHFGEEWTVQIALNGALEISRRDEIAARLPAPESADRVVIDCSAATSIDSAIISVLMRYRRSFAAGGGDPLNIIIVEPHLRRIFEISGLSRMLTIVSAPHTGMKSAEETLLEPQNDPSV